jgi:hypothetical protein
MTQKYSACNINHFKHLRMLLLSSLDGLQSDVER